VLCEYHVIPARNSRTRASRDAHARMRSADISRLRDRFLGYPSRKYLPPFFRRSFLLTGRVAPVRGEGNDVTGSVVTRATIVFPALIDHVDRSRVAAATARGNRGFARAVSGPGSRCHCHYRSSLLWSPLGHARDCGGLLPRGLCRAFCLVMRACA